MKGAERLLLVLRFSSEIVRKQSEKACKIGENSQTFCEVFPILVQNNLKKVVLK
ncbi:hypothetical protein APP_03900 [Aeribacillus pallidus]|jgi:hypothetical protein|nr:hypothetical protein APP_03900 [Aeribacillus pallidus]